MKIQQILIRFASAACLLSAGTTVHAERVAFMPQGEVVAPPPGFADLCLRDAASCDANGVRQQALAIPSANQFPTSSLGGSADPELGARLRAEREATIDADKEELAYVRFEQLEAYRPVIDASFLPAGAERPADQTEAEPLLAQSAPVGPMLVKNSMMRLVNGLNQDVNREVRKASDFDLYGLLEFWSLPRKIDGKMYGDCEDYALEKRRRLIAKGVPAEALSMAVAVTARGETHAVLVVSFESGDWVLDNLTPWATPWNELNYQWVERQVAGSSEWKKIT